MTYAVDTKYVEIPLLSHHCAYRPAFLTCCATVLISPPNFLLLFVNYFND